MSASEDNSTFQNNSNSTNGICGLCGRKDLKLVLVDSEEAIENDLSNKIELYIPINLDKFKNIPVECCSECMKTILSWHDFVINVLEVNKKPLDSSSVEPSTVSGNEDSEKRGIVLSTETSLQIFHQDPHIEVQHNISTESPTNVDREDGKIGIDYYMRQSPQSCPDSEEEEVEINQSKEDKSLITSLSHSRDNISNSDYLDDEYCEKEICDKLKRTRTKIDPKIIEEAKVVVGDRTYYNCKDCGKNLLSPYTYVWHMRIHTGERPFMCDLCGKQFRVSQGLVRHLKETHKRIKNFSCDLCGRMFATKRNVEEHRRIHTNERPYVCNLCQKRFKQKASLFVHNRTHSNTFPFKCEYCNQAFRTRPPLLIHITKHTGQKPYPCDVCGRCFRIKYELNRHKLVHSEEKPFVCSCCGLKFKQKRYLRNHFKTNHTDVSHFLM